jgi:hypothetical protein
MYFIPLWRHCYNRFQIGFTCKYKNNVNQYRNENNKASFDESNVYSLFVYAVRSQITRDYYHRLLRIFFTILISTL